MNLPADLLAQIQAAIADGSLQLGGTGRSPNRPRQLHDLRLLPTKDDPRPTFFWSAESPRDNPEVFKTHEFPKLLWHGVTGEEITVASLAQQDEKIAIGYVLVAPASVVISSLDAMKIALESLPEADRKLIINGQRKQRNQALQDRMAKLSDAELDQVLAAAEEMSDARKSA